MSALQDFVIAEHVSLLRSSRADFIQELFAESEAEAAEASALAANSRVRRGSKSAFKLNSVGAQFRKQLQVAIHPALHTPCTAVPSQRLACAVQPYQRQACACSAATGGGAVQRLGAGSGRGSGMQGLMGTLVQCQPHFIRCIKPNPASQPGQLDPEYVLEQLRAGGVLEAVRIACAGFPTRKLFRWARLSSTGCSVLMKPTCLLPSCYVLCFERLPRSTGAAVDIYSSVA